MLMFMGILLNSSFGNCDARRFPNEAQQIVNQQTWRPGREQGRDRHPLGFFFFFSRELKALWPVNLFQSNTCGVRF